MAARNVEERTDVFDAPPARTIEQQIGFKLSLIDIGDGRELNVSRSTATMKRNARRRCSVGAALTMWGFKQLRSMRLRRSGGV